VGIRHRQEWQTSIAVLEPLLRLNRDELSPTEAGIAWNLLGTAYQSVGEYQKARRSFEAALRLLQNSSAPVGQQAAALDNFASLQLEVGQTEAAEKLRNKAKRLYEAERDHAGIARVSGNLAILITASPTASNNGCCNYERQDLHHAQMLS